eukprot:gene8719-11781_t
MSQIPRGSKRLASAEPPRTKDWEDEFHRLKTKYDELKVEFNEKEQFNKLQQSKIRKMESDLKKLELELQAGTPRTAGTNVTDREERNHIAELTEENSRLKSKNNALSAKNNQLTEQVDKMKKEINVLKRIINNNSRKAARPGKTEEIEIVPGPNHVRPASAPKPHHVDNEPELLTDAHLEVARKYKLRLNSAEEQIQLLKDENNRLKSTGNPRANTIDLENQLRDKTWHLQQLQTQYDYLVSKTSAQSESYKKSEEQIEDYQQKIRELRRTLEELKHEKEYSDGKAMKVSSLEELVNELRQANRNLEDRITRLCEAPFISDAFGQQEAKLRYETLLSERADLQSKVDHLQEAVRTHFSALTSLKQHAAQLREEKEIAEKKAEELRMQLQDVQSGTDVLQEKLKLYADDGDFDVETLERALTLVKRRGDAIQKLPFLEDPDGDQLVTLPVMKRKLEEVQLLNLKLSEESERLESMLKLQSGINRDLHKELEALVRARDKDKKEYLQKAESFEEIALKRLDKIHSLEAQVRQFVYGLAKNRKKVGAASIMNDVVNNGMEVSFNGSEDENNEALLAELLEEKGGDVKPDENLLEIWIRNAVIKDGVLLPGSSSFVVIDFFDYESQTTSVISSSKPEWDFAATYKITVDDFLLRFLATDVVTLELNMASQGDFSMLARCSIPLSALLRSKPKMHLVNYPMLSATTGQVIAHINLDIRLALPVSELYRLFLERHPGEKKHIEELSAQRVIQAASLNELANSIENAKLTLIGGKEDDSRLYNELEIMIHKAMNLPLCDDNSLPTTFVHFQFLGHPDSFTNPVADSVEPVYNEKFNFKMVTNDSQMRLIERFKLQFSILDMKTEEQDATTEGLIGEVYISLADLADGNPIVGEILNVKSSHGKKVAELQISIRWKYPLKRERELGPRALSGVETEILISTFSTGESHEGVIDYNAFCRYIDPPNEVSVALEKLRAFSNSIIERDGLTARKIFLEYFDESKPIDEELFKQRLLKTQIDVLPNDFIKLFKYIDTAQSGRISLNQYLAVLNIDENIGIPIILFNKLRERGKDLARRGVPAIILFQNADQWGADGLVTRMEFKNVLKKMGFNLADEPEPIQGQDIAKHSQPNTSRQQEPFAGQDLLNDTLQSEEIHDEELLDAQSSGREQHDTIQKSLKKDREVFERKKMDLQIRNQQALQLEMDNQTTSIKSDGTDLVEQKLPSARGTQPIISNVESRDADFDHRVSVSRTNAPFPRSHDRNVTEMSATKLQAHFRGYETRKKLGGTIRRKASTRYSDNVGTSTEFISNSVNGIATQGLKEAFTNDASNILIVENILRESVIDNRGQPLPDLMEKFLTLDKKRLGYVKKQQFAFALQQFPSINLHGEELIACMNFFDVSGDGTMIDYAAFVRFYRYKEPELLPYLERMQKMVFDYKVLNRFRVSDSNGHGYLRRSEMMALISDLGYGQLSNTIMLSMLDLFETKSEGLVNYPNFVEFVRDNELSKSLDDLSLQVFNIMTSDGIDNAAVRNLFNQIDKTKQGKFSIQNFGDFLVERNLQVSKEVVLAFYLELDSNNSGVLFSKFMAWLNDYAKHGPPFVIEQSIYAGLTMVELQIKAHRYMAGIASSATVSLDTIIQSYMIYDWRKSDLGAIAKPLFLRATKRAGFPFTNNEIRVLGSEFSLNNNGEIVSYKKFLSWATPSLVSTTKSQGNVSIGNAQVRSVGSIIRFLEKAFRRGIDLLSVFGRYDSSSVGRISSNEFCSALSDLGLSSVSQKEALELADRYRAASGDFVLYRKIVQEILRQMDEVTGAADVDVVDMLKIILQKSNMDSRRLKDIFAYYDRKHNGCVRIDDLGTIFEEAKMKIRRTEIDAIADKFSVVKAPGWMQYTEFMSLLETRMNEMPVQRKSFLLPEAIAEKIKTLLESLILRGKDYRNELDKFDDQINGSIIQNDFRMVMLDRFGANLSMKEIEIIEKAYRYPDDPRKIYFTKLIHHLHPRNYGRVTITPQIDPYTTAPPIVINANSEVWECLEDLRQKIRKRCDYSTPGELRRPFRHFARRKNDKKTVTFDDFALAIRNLGIRLAGDQERAVFDSINLNGPSSRAFKYCDFVVFVCDPQHADLVWKLRRGVAKARISESEIINSLTDQDSNASNLITAKQFMKAMKLCSIDLSDSDVNRLMLRFDTEENQRFDVDKFIRFLKGKASDELEDDLENLKPSENSVTSKKSVEFSETHAWETLKSRIIDKLEAGFTPKEVFSLFDPDGRGVLDVMSLHQGAREVGLSISRAEIRSVLRRMSLIAGGPVNRVTFYEALQIDMDDYVDQELRRAQRRKGSKQRKQVVVDDDEDDVLLASRRTRVQYDDLEEQHSDNSGRDTSRGDRISSSELREILKAISSQIQNSKNLKYADDPKENLLAVLDKFGLKKIGYVSTKEMSRAFDSISVRVPHRDILSIFTYFDRDDLGVIKINKFISEIFDKSSSSRSSNQTVQSSSRSPRNLVRNALRRRVDLSEELLDQLKSISSNERNGLDLLLIEFEKVDIDKSGSIGKSEFLRCIAKSGIKLEAVTERDLVDTITEESKSNQIAYNDFIDAISTELRSDDIVDDIISRVRKSISRNTRQGKDIEQAFSNADKDGNGEVDAEELISALRVIGIPLTRDEARKIVTKYSMNGRSMKFKEFIRAFNFSASADDEPNEDLQLILARIRSIISDRLGSGANAARKLKELFEKIDADGDGEVSQREFKEIMKTFKVELNTDEINGLFRRFDFSGNGTLGYTEFIKLVDFSKGQVGGRESTISHQLIQDTDDLVQMIRRKLIEELGPGSKSAEVMKETFSDMDRNDDRKLDPREFAKAMSKLHIELLPKDIDVIYERYDRDHDKLLDYQEFIEVLNFDGIKGGGIRIKENKVSESTRKETDEIIANLRRDLEKELGPGA